MNAPVHPMSPAELDRIGRTDPRAALGVLRTDRGNLPLDRLDVRAAVTGLVVRTVLTTEFVNVHDTVLEATYVFPLPDRAAVTGMTMTADGRTVTAELQERGAAREAYDVAVAAGQRAAIAEEDRPDVFTMRVGNMAPGERVSVELSLVGPLAYEDGAATFRFPLVVAPRYVPGVPLPGEPVGDGHAADTDAVPDASRISPPVLLPGFPNPVRLSIGVDVDPAGLTLGEVRSSLHTVHADGTRYTIAPGERVDRDFVLRLSYTGAGATAVCVPDAEGDEGTYQLLVFPPDDAVVARPRDVVLLLDRSGSMSGWAMVAARRAAARIVDTLTADDRFLVGAFDTVVEYAEELGGGLHPATDRNRYRAVEHLVRVEARGGTELLAPLRTGLQVLADGDAGRDRVLVLVTDGQVGNEDAILRDIAALLNGTRVHTVGIDTAVNAGFLGRLAAIGGGRCELVESEDRLDEAMEHIQRRIGAPVVTGVEPVAEGMELVADTRTPRKPAALYPGVPLVVAGRYRGPAADSVTLRGRARDGAAWRSTVAVAVRDDRAVPLQWARAHLRDLEDRRITAGTDLEQRITATSLRFGVLCRFTAFVAVDTEVVEGGGAPRRVVQPVELPAGWEAPSLGVQTYGMQSFGAPIGMAAASPFAASGAAPPPVPFAAPGFAGGPPGGRPGARAAGAGYAPQGAQAWGQPPAASSVTGVPAYGAAPPASDDTALREIIGLEADRLRNAGGLPPHERRELLDDLLSRLGTLVDGGTDDRQAPLRELVARLRTGGELDDGDLDALWSVALDALDAFLAVPPAKPAARKRFWR